MHFCIGDRVFCRSSLSLAVRRTGGLFEYLPGGEWAAAADEKRVSWSKEGPNLESEVCHLDTRLL